MNIIFPEHMLEAQLQHPNITYGHQEMVENLQQVKPSLNFIYVKKKKKKKLSPMGSPLPTKRRTA